MQLEVIQSINAEPAGVIWAFRTEAFYRSLRDLPFVGSPELVSFESNGADVLIDLRYRVAIDLPGPARAFIDPDKLTFVESSRLHPDGTGTFEIRPDHYGTLLSSSGETAVAGDSGACQRTMAGSLDVDLGWKGKIFEHEAEKAIAGGLEQALLAQVAQVEAFVNAVA